MEIVIQLSDRVKWEPRSENIKGNKKMQMCLK